MNLKRLTVVFLIALLALSSAAVAVFAARDSSNNLAPASNVVDSASAEVSQQAANGTYRYVYSVKFVCGFQQPLVDVPGTPPRGEPVVKPGNYATEINIHNYNFRTAELRKKVILLVRPSQDGKDQDVVREPRTTGPLTNAAGAVAWESFKLEKDFATLDDCNKFWIWTYPNVVPPVPFPLMVGYLVIYSSLDLDVDAVYTAAAPGPVSRESQSVSIDVERVPAKRVFVPVGEIP
jgi:hypothetical protein